MAKITITARTRRGPDDDYGNKMTNRQAQIMKQAINSFLRSEDFADFIMDNGFDLMQYDIQIFGQ